MNPEDFNRLLSRFEDASVALHAEGTASAQERWHAAGDAIREEFGRLHVALAGIADYTDERRHAVADGQGLAQHALRTVGDMARQAIGRNLKTNETKES